MVEFVYTKLYVKGEEHDANKLFSGNILKQYFIDLESGEIEEIQ